MKTRPFRITTAGSRAGVRHALLNDAHFRQWTANFAEGSYYEGGVIRVLTAGGDGMVIVIAENRPNEYLSIKHIGVVNQGIDDTDSDGAKAWAPAYENNTLREIKGGTELKVHMDVVPEY